MMLCFCPFYSGIQHDFKTQGTVCGPNVKRCLARVNICGEKRNATWIVFVFSKHDEETLFGKSQNVHTARKMLKVTIYFNCFPTVSALAK